MISDSIEGVLGLTHRLLYSGHGIEPCLIGSKHAYSHAYYHGGNVLTFLQHVAAVYINIYIQLSPH